MLAADEAGEARLDVIERTVLRPSSTPASPSSSRCRARATRGRRGYRSVLRHLAAHDLNVKLNLHTNGLLDDPRPLGRVQGLGSTAPRQRLHRRLPPVDVRRALAPRRRVGAPEANLRFITNKAPPGAVSAFFLNATVQLDNFHELADMVALGAELGCDGVRFYLIQNTGGHLADDYARKNVAAPDHPLHLAFPSRRCATRARAPLAHLYDDPHRARGGARRDAPLRRRGVASAQDCVAGFPLYMNAGDPERAAAVAAHGCWRFPSRASCACSRRRAGDARVRGPGRVPLPQCLRRDPDDFNALVALGTRLIEGRRPPRGLRQLVAAASTTRDPAVLDGITDHTS